MALSVEQFGLFDTRAPALPSFMLGLDEAIDEALGIDRDGLRYYQRTAHSRIMSTLEEVKAVLIVLATGLGKAQPLSARVLTPAGWTTMGNLSRLDRVIGSDGLAHTVTGVYPQGEKLTYRVRFSDDTETRCCAEHLWSVRTKSQKARGEPYAVRSTEQLMGDLHDGSGAAKWFVPVVAPVELAYLALPISPWLLGMLLGDGCLRDSVIFSSVDPYIIDRAARESGCPVKKLRPGADDCDYLISEGRVGRRGSKLANALRALGVWGKLAHEKRIPEAYLLGRAADRLELLRGIMDTDGYCTGAGAELTTTSPGLAQDVAELVRSLGGTTTIRMRKTAKRDAYRLRVNIEANPFSMPRKAERYHGDARAMRTRAIVAIEPDVIEACQCISVSAPDKLYVTDDYLLTHNTQVFSVVAKDWPGRVLVLAHRDELVSQARARLQQITGEQVGLEQGQWRSGRERIVVGSTQTVYRKDRLEELALKGGFTLVIVDEAHHYTASTYRRPLEYFADAKILGVTATPDRGDKMALGQIFQKVAMVVDVREGVSMGYLTPVHGERVWIESVDLTNVKSTAGDLNVKQLDELMVKAAEGVVTETIKRWPERKGIVFLPGKASAQLACERFNALRPDCAAVVTDETPKEERRRIMAAVKRGQVQFLCNCMVATEGFDWPHADIVVIARPTKSRALYAQMVGRGTRVLPGLVEHIHGPDGAAERRALIQGSSKPGCLVVDFVGNAGKHQLIAPEDILGGDFTPAEVKRAKKIAEQHPGREAEQNLSDARHELRLLAKKMESQVKAKAEKFDPFKVYHIDNQPETIDVKYGQVPASPGQLRALEGFGMSPKELGALSKGEASKLLNTAIKRRELGLATFRQLKVLQKFGVPDVNVPFDRARAAMEYLQQIGFGRLSKVDPEQLNRIITKQKAAAHGQ